MKKKQTTRKLDKSQRLGHFMLHFIVLAEPDSRSNWLNKFKIRFSKGKNLISKHWFWCLKYEHKVFQKEISQKLNEGKGINFHIAGINSNAKESINK